MTLALYDLEGEGGRRFSPFCWRARLALAHKGLTPEDRPIGYADIRRIGDGSFRTAPVIEHDGRFVGDSWQIALYLDEAFPEAPPLFEAADSLALAQFVEKWLMAQIFPTLFPALVKHVHDHLKPEDQAYFRQSRESRFGATLEEMDAQGARGLGAMTVALEPLRNMIRNTPFLHGEAPGYADYVAVSPFLWARGCYPHPLLQSDDPVAAWYGRCLDLHDGLARSTPGYDIVGEAAPGGSRH